mgnify:CR=1 FL=1
MLRVGVIGTGVMGAEHARLLREEISGACLAGVCDVAVERAEVVACGARVFTDALALIADVDAVIVASPDATHSNYTRASIALGKPVICEKPIAASAADGLTIVEAEVAGGRALVTVGFMRRFDPAYVEMRAALQSGRIGRAVILHNIHRNVSAPDWFTGAMTITNSFVHEIDISRFLLGEEMADVQVSAAPGDDPLMITMRTDAGTVVSTEVNINAGYGYHVYAQIVGRSGTIEMVPPASITVNNGGHGGLSYAPNWVPRFAEAYRRQMQAWVDGIARGVRVGASAWDGYVTTAIAEQAVGAMASGNCTAIRLPPRPALYN